VGSQIAGTRSRRASSGEHPGVDPVGLAGQRGQALDLLRVGDLDLPPGQLKLVVDEPGAVHRFDRGHDRLAKPGGLPGQAPQPISVWRRRGDLDWLTRLVHQVHIQAVARQIQPCVQHGGASLWCSRW
jgi:hypothetical protein